MKNKYDFYYGKNLFRFFFRFSNHSLSFFNSSRIDRKIERIMIMGN